MIIKSLTSSEDPESPSLKDDAEAIKLFIQGLASRLQLRDKRKYWPNWLYRSDHVENVVRILGRGELLSRAVAESKNLIEKDSGSSQHIAELSSEQRRFVRLYFRPCTPTQYTNEGFLPVDKIKYDAHMPVPVYLLFSSSLLMTAGVEFTLGRLRANSIVGSSAEFLADMNFKEIYHDGSVGRLGDEGRRQKLNARHSEVLVKDKLSLNYLKHIVCRTRPERETLLNLLSLDTRNRWEKRVVYDDGRRGLFNRRGTFINHVDLLSNSARFVFSIPSEPEFRGPFHLKIKLLKRFQKTLHENEHFTVSDRPLEFDIPEDKVGVGYKVEIRMNEDIAYLGEFNKNDSLLSPF